MNLYDGNEVRANTPERPAPLLWIVVPAYNEHAVLPYTCPLFVSKLRELIVSGSIAPNSKICFINDGSTDDTWSLIQSYSIEVPEIIGISLSRNMGHQNALLCGLLESIPYCDAAISIDCDGQDDIDAMDEMVKLYRQGIDVVYGVRSSRKSDTAFKRFSAELFYRLLSAMGVESVFNHADYRLMSKEALRGLSLFQETNLFLRGLVPLVGFSSATVEYERAVRVAGDSHYPLGKMLHLAIDGITSLSVKPIRILAASGLLFGMLGLVGSAWAISSFVSGNTIAGWASTICAVLLIGGMQLFGVGLIGEYVGRIYLEVKHRPRYIIRDKTGGGAPQ